MLLEITNAFGLVANITSNMAFVPQIIKSYRCKKVEDISIGMFCILFFTQICWVIYAIPLHANQLMVSCTIEIFLLLPIFFMWWRYSRPNYTHPSLANTPIELASDI